MRIVGVTAEAGLPATLSPARADVTAGAWVANAAATAASAARATAAGVQARGALFLLLRCSEQEPPGGQLSSKLPQQ